MKIGPYPLSDARWSIEDLGSDGPAAGRRRGGRASAGSSILGRLRARIFFHYIVIGPDRSGLPKWIESATGSYRHRKRLIGT